MNIRQSPSFLLLSCAFLAGCVTDEPKQDIVMPQMQQNTYLSHAKPPQQFGFSVYAVDDGIAYSGSARLHPNHFATEKMVHDDIPIIEIHGRAQREKINTLIDFSSPSSWLEFSASQDIGAHFIGINDMVIPYRGGYNTGGVNAYAAVATQLRMDQLFIENTPFYVRMASGSLGPLARGILSPKIDAVLGYDNLRNFEYVQINLRDRSISFSSTRPYTPHEELMLDVAKIINLRGYGLAIEGAVDNQPMPIILDFAGNFRFARGDVKVSTTEDVRLGHLPFHQVPTLVLPINNSPARAGRKMLSAYIITICNKEGVVYFERPPK
ncbi:MAG: hypothetical protein K9M54_10115 [Kiritimatiellales bacterium]|nr:hypothetical protein [Kiritimatiellales bacterium]